MMMLPRTVVVKSEAPILCDESNVSGSNGQDNSEVNAASSPLVRGSVKQSCHDQDSQAHEAATTGRSQYEATKKVRDDF